MHAHTCPQALAKWMAALPVEDFGGRVVRPLQRLLARFVDSGQGWPAARDDVLRVGQVRG